MRVNPSWADGLGRSSTIISGGLPKRFTTSAFMRAKLGEALARRKLAPHIFETEAEALGQMQQRSMSKP